MSNDGSFKNNSDMKILLGTFTFFLFLFSCQKEPTTNTTTQQGQGQAAPCADASIEEKVWKEGNKTFLYGGDADSMHFDITSWSLKKCNLNYGIGREKFQALLDPVYTPISEVNNIPNYDKCIVLQTENEVKVYPYVIMSYHEVVNEKINNYPIAIAYCILADLAVVYDTRICNTDLTFAVSGYTYAEENVFDNIQAFVLWDRETESLWWPLIDMGVSGVFNSIELKKFDEDKWETMIWEDIILEFPDAKVLEVQNQEPPQTDFRIDKGLVDC